MSEDPLTNPEEILYTDGSSFVLDGKRARYAVISNFEATETKLLPPGTSAQLAELIALTQTLELGKRHLSTQKSLSELSSIIISGLLFLLFSHQDLGVLSTHK